MSGSNPIDTEWHRRRAIAAVRRAVDVLTGLGVTALVTGSLARGGFGPHSDVDFLVTACPRHLKYAIEGVVEDNLDGVPFDVVYLDEIPEWRVRRFTESAVDARDLG
ncbi:MAG TPA: nucleotidyltransferase domain-containing protein [Rhodopila sp.]|jgi:predicted nucleotidyltransferase